MPLHTVHETTNWAQTLQSMIMKPKSSGNEVSISAWIYIRSTTFMFLFLIVDVSLVNMLWLSTSKSFLS